MGLEEKIDGQLTAVTTLLAPAPEELLRLIHTAVKGGLNEPVAVGKQAYNAHKFTDDIERKIDDISSRNLRKYYGLEIFYMVSTYTCWLFMYEVKLVNSISHTEIRNILLKHRIKWRHSKII